MLFDWRQTSRKVPARPAGNDSDPRWGLQLARFLVNSWEGATIRLKITQDREPIDDFLNVAFKALLK